MHPYINPLIVLKVPIMIIKKKNSQLRANPCGCGLATHHRWKTLAQANTHEKADTDLPIL